MVLFKYNIGLLEEFTTSNYFAFLKYFLEGFQLLLLQAPYSRDIGLDPVSYYVATEHSCYLFSTVGMLFLITLKCHVRLLCKFYFVRQSILQQISVKGLENLAIQALFM